MRKVDDGENTSLAAMGALAHCLQSPTWPPGGSKIAYGSGKGYTLLGALNPTARPKLVRRMALDPYRTKFV